jgi:hypothetical protein
VNISKGAEQAQRSLAAFKPKLLNDLIRMGNAYDGGYVVNTTSVLHSRYLISFGVNDDWSFEKEFLRRQPPLTVLCFDHSVSKDIFLQRLRDALNEILSIRFLLLILSLNVRGVRRRLSLLKRWARIYLGFRSFFRRENARFISKGISNNHDNNRFIDLDDVFQMIPRERLSDNSIFVKMDIELSEFRVLPQLAKFEKYVSGMVVEFHDLDILWPAFAEQVTQLREHFEITHIHGNNFGGLIPDSKIPRVLEVTFLSKTLIKEAQEVYKTVRYPIPELDYPNDPLGEDYALEF